MDAGLSAVPLAAQNAILSDVYVRLSPDSWADKLDLAAKYLAAHLGAMVVRGGGVGAAGIVLSMSLNGASTSFANPLTGGQGMLGSWGSTVWGQEFAAMLAALPRGMVL